MLRIIAALFLIVSCAPSVENTTNPQRELDFIAAQKTPQGHFIQRTLVMLLVAQPEQNLQTTLTLAGVVKSFKLLIDLQGISSDSMLDALSGSQAKTYQSAKFQGSGITLQKGQLSERAPTLGRSIRGLLWNVDRRYVVNAGDLTLKLIARDFGNMRDGARSGLLIAADDFGQPGDNVFTVIMTPELLKLYQEVWGAFVNLPDQQQQQVISDILSLQISQVGRKKKQEILQRLLKSVAPSREIVLAEPNTDHLSCPRSIPREFSRKLVPAGGNALVRTLSQENIQGMVIRTPVKGEEIAAIDFSKIPDQAQRDYMEMMANLVRHKVEDPALSRDERQAILDGFKADVDHMMKTGTFNPVAHRTFASIFAEYTLYNALSLGLGKLPWAMGMLKSTVVETVVPPSSFLNTTITAATCTAALPGIAGQVTQKRLDPYAVVKEEGQTTFQAMHPDEVAKHKPSAFMQGAAMACSAAAGMVVMAGCNAALSAAGVDDGTTSAVLAAGVVLVAKSAAEAAMLHTPTQKKVESVVRPAVGVSRSALRWLWGVITEVPDVGDDDVYLF